LWKLNFEFQENGTPGFNKASKSYGALSLQVSLTYLRGLEVTELTE